MFAARGLLGSTRQHRQAQAARRERVVRAIAGVLEPVVLAVLVCVPGDAARTWRGVNGESGERRLHVPITRLVRRLVDNTLRVAVAVAVTCGVIGALFVVAASRQPPRAPSAAEPPAARRWALPTDAIVYDEAPSFTEATPLPSAFGGGAAFNITFAHRGESPATETHTVTADVLGAELQRIRAFHNRTCLSAPQVGVDANVVVIAPSDNAAWWRCDSVMANVVEIQRAHPMVLDHEREGDDGRLTRCRIEAGVVGQCLRRALGAIDDE